ncbi:MAG: hypothetical protein ACKVPX_08875 [Myxococcaceae bacterium]
MASVLKARPAGALLFVKRVANVSSALARVNTLLWQRRLLGAYEDAVLGIMFGEQLDEGQLVAPNAPDIRLRESVGLSGTWSLCWFESMYVPESQDFAGQRQRLLDCLLPLRHPLREASCSPSERYRFSVVTSSDSREDIVPLAADLKKRYPMLPVLNEVFLYNRRFATLQPHLQSGSFVPSGSAVA